MPIGSGRLYPPSLESSMVDPSTQSSPRDGDPPVIGVTMGDPRGIGPEVLVKALADPAVRRMGRFVIYGQNQVLVDAAERAGIEPYWMRVAAASERAARGVIVDPVVYDYDADDVNRASSQAGAAPAGQGPSAPPVPAKVPAPPTAAARSPGSSTPRDPAAPGSSARGGLLSKTFVEDAIADALRPAGERRRIEALVTGPISKESWAMAGFRWPGHTELLAARSKAKRHVMLFWSPKLCVALATAHVSLADIRDLLTIGRVFEPIDLGNEFCQRLGIRAPRIAVCGVNPHAGEHGLFGDDESRVVSPAIEMAQRSGINAQGPFPADSIFIAASRGEWDLVVAMYHDQGLIPLKLLARDQAVNVTVGLPFVRTSPDHGTAFDIAGQNRADPGSMKAAIALAAQLAHAQIGAPSPASSDSRPPLPGRSQLRLDEPHADLD